MGDQIGPKQPDATTTTESWGTLQIGSVIGIDNLTDPETLRPGSIGSIIDLDSNGAPDIMIVRNSSEFGANSQCITGFDYYSDINDNRLLYCSVKGSIPDSLRQEGRAQLLLARASTAKVVDDLTALKPSDESVAILNLRVDEKGLPDLSKNSFNLQGFLISFDEDIFSVRAPNGSTHKFYYDDSALSGLPILQEPIAYFKGAKRRIIDSVLDRFDRELGNSKSGELTQLHVADDDYPFNTFQLFYNDNQYSMFARFDKAGKCIAIDIRQGSTEILYYHASDIILKGDPLRIDLFRDKLAGIEVKVKGRILSDILPMAPGKE